MLISPTERVQFNGLLDASEERLFQDCEALPRTESGAEYDEVDRRLMDTFPASDAIGRYRG